MRGEDCEATAHLTHDMWITASMHIIRKHREPPTYQSISEHSVFTLTMNRCICKCE